jgi:hypothetical protein
MIRCRLYGRLIRHGIRLRGRVRPRSPAVKFRKEVLILESIEVERDRGSHESKEGWSVADSTPDNQVPVLVVIEIRAPDADDTPGRKHEDKELNRVSVVLVLEEGFSESADAIRSGITVKSLEDEVFLCGSGKKFFRLIALIENKVYLRARDSEYAIATKAYVRESRESVVSHEWLEDSRTLFEVRDLTTKILSKCRRDEKQDQS